MFAALTIITLKKKKKRPLLIAFMRKNIKRFLVKIYRGKRGKCSGCDTKGMEKTRLVEYL